MYTLATCTVHTHALAVHTHALYTHMHCARTSDSTNLLNMKFWLTWNHAANGLFYT